MDGAHTALLALGLATLFGIEMILAGLARQNLAVLGDLEAL